MRRWVCLAAAAAALVSAAPARAYEVRYDHGNGCGLFTASAGASLGYGASVCGASTMRVDFPIAEATVKGGTEENISTRTPAGLEITDATAAYSLGSSVGTRGWGSGDFYSGGGVSWNPPTFSPITDPPFNSSVWGFQLTCGQSAGCSPLPPGTPTAPHNDPASVQVGSVTFDVAETVGPSITPTRPNLYYQTGHYVWNPPGDPWPIGAAASAPSGICSLDAIANGQSVNLENDTTPNPYAWQQCPNGSWSHYLDTRSYVPKAGSLGLAFRASSKAGNSSSLAQTLKVDNEPISVGLSTPNDPDLAQWVNHPVTVQASASAGPSGIGGMNCSADGAKPTRYPPGGLTINGDGIHKVACTAWNRAVDPQGQPNATTARTSVRIDEAPPAIQFAAVNPADPTQLVVQTSDPESGVSGGLITMKGPHAKRPTALSADLAGSEMLSRFNDGGKNGNYTFTATACDHVGNCASTQETLHFPIRLHANGLVSFAKIQTPAKTVHRRVRVGYHFKTVHRRVRVGYRLKTVHRRRHGKILTRQVKIGGHFKRVKRRVKVGGHFKRVKVVIHANRRCGHRRVKTGRHRWREISVCRVMRPRIVSHRRVRYGHKAKLHGLLMTAQGAPIADAPVKIFTRPDDRGGIYRLAATATTDARGRWVAKIPGGPSRAIRAYYPGAADVEPVTAHAKVIVPAKITLHITPHVLPWSHTMHISGHLAGRYHPHDGVALRLLVRYPHTHAWTPLQALRTNRLGGFRFSWSYHAGRGVATYPFKIATTSNETDYPYAASASPAVRVTFGKRTPHMHQRQR